MESLHYIGAVINGNRETSIATNKPTFPKELCVFNQYKLVFFLCFINKI